MADKQEEFPMVTIDEEASALLADARAKLDAFDLAGVIADVEPDELVKAEMPVDELEDDEELVTEIPVHGVATIEGRATGDGRGFRPNALSIGAMPQPLGYEYVSTHGGDTSNVAIVGRIDEYWREEVEPGVFELRWRGVIMPGKPYGAQAIESIVDGSYRGLSVIVDSVEVDVTEQREEARQRFLAEQAGEDVEFDIEAALDDMIGDGKQPTTWFSAARVRRFDMVPTGAFQEGYTDLGHEFLDEMEPDDIEAAEQALADCGCVTEFVDLTSLTFEELEAYDALSVEEQAAFAKERRLVSLIASGAVEALRTYTEEQRREMAEDGRALPDGSYPIADLEDLRNAIQAIGRAKDRDAAIAHIKKRARELDAEDVLPEDWSVEGVMAAAFAPGTHDGPGWITHPIPTSRIRRYWVSGEGAAKIRWGTPGSFNRCRAQLAKYVQNPEWLAGLCANMYKEATGRWPGVQRGDKGLSLSAAAPLVVMASAESRTVYPASAFAEPRDARPFALRIDREARTVQGYAASWDTCHVGISGMCQTPPHSSSDYAYFRKGVVDTDSGEQRVALLTMGIGHAGQYDSAAAATAHYDQTDAVRAYINIGENSKGIWYAGVLAPWVTDADIDAMRAIGRVSGDWRSWSGRRGDLEMVGLVVVNTEGYQLAASGGIQTAAIGLGALPKDVEAPTSVAASAAEQVGVLEAEFVEFDVDGMAAIVAEKVVQLQERREILSRVAPARAAVTHLALAHARAKLDSLTKE